MICPHCHKDTNSLTYQQVSEIVDNVKAKYSEEVRSRIRLFLASLPNLDKRNMVNFLARIEQYPAEDIYFGIDYFLRLDLHQKGKSWEYCAAIIARRYNTRKSDGKLPALPPEIP